MKQRLAIITQIICKLDNTQPRLKYQLEAKQAAKYAKYPGRNVILVFNRKLHDSTDFIQNLNVELANFGVSSQNVEILENHDNIHNLSSLLDSHSQVKTIILMTRHLRTLSSIKR